MGFKEYLLTKGIEKALKGVVIGIITWLGTLPLAEAGVSVDVSVFEGFLLATLLGLVSFVRNYGKVKLGFDWL